MGVVAEGETASPLKGGESGAGSIVSSLMPPPHTVPQLSEVDWPALVNTYGSAPYNVMSVPRREILPK